MGGTPVSSPGHRRALLFALGLLLSAALLWFASEGHGGEAATARGQVGVEREGSSPDLEFEGNADPARVALGKAPEDRSDSTGREVPPPLVTDSDGRFTFEGLPVHGHTPALAAMRVGFAPLFERLSALRSGRITDLGDVAWAGTGIASGVVLDGDDRPVSGASIYWTRADRGVLTAKSGVEVTRSDVAGSFRAVGLPVGLLHLSAARPGDGSSWSPPLEIKTDGEIEDVVLRVEPGVTLRGRIESLRTGEPISGVVSAFGPGKRRPTRVTSDEKGRFELAGLVRGARYNWLVRSEGHRYSRYEDGYGGGNVFRADESTLAEPFVITMLPSGLLPLRVVVADTGLPVEGALVLRAPYGLDGPSAADEYFVLGETDAAGRFVFDPQRPAGSSVYVKAPGYGIQMAYTLPEIVEETEVVVELVPEGGLLVRVTRAGQPVPEAEVELVRPDRDLERSISNEGQRVIDRGKSDADGRVSFDLSNASFTYLQVRTDGELVAFGAVDSDAPAPLEVEIPIPRPGRILGTVSGASPSDIVVASLDDTRWWVRDRVFSGRVDGDGGYSLAGLVPGRYKLALVRSRAGHDPGGPRLPSIGLEVEVLPGADVRLDLRAVPCGGRLRGRAWIDEGPVGERDLLLEWKRPLDGGSVDLYVERRIVTTEPDGFFRAEGMEEGVWQVGLFTDCGNPSLRGFACASEVEVVAGQEAILDLEGHVARVRLVGRTSDGEPLEDRLLLEVRLVEPYAPGAAFRESLAVGESGALTLAEVPAGRLRIVRADGEGDEQFVDLTPGGDHEVVFVGSE